MKAALTWDTTSLGSVTPVDNRWTANLLSLSASNHTLAATATFTNGQIPGTATSSFTVAGTNGVTNYFDAAGYVTNRVFYNSNKVQQLSWDGLGRLVSVVERDYLTNGYNWSAIYDATGRRLRTTNVLVNGGVTNVASTLTIDSYYDPQVKYSEVGVGVDGVRTWKVLGPDITGSCGGMHGVGALEATVLETDGTTVPVLNDNSGNVLATIGTGSVTWNPIRVGAYGPVSGYRPETVGPGTVLAETLVWRSRWMDQSGLYCLGARYYDPVAGHFLAPDPLGHAACMDLYSFCSGDPCNRFDPDGRLARGFNQGVTLGSLPNGANAAYTAGYSAGAAYLLSQFMDGGGQSSATAAASGSNPSGNGSYGTLAVGVNMGGSILFVNASLTTGFVVDTDGDIGVFQTKSGGGGFGVNEGVGIFVGLSNAEDIDNYKEGSIDLSGAGGLVAGGSVDYSSAFNGGGTDGTLPFKEIGFTAGEDTGVSLQGSGSYTTVVPIGNVFDAIGHFLDKAVGSFDWFLAPNE